MFLSSKKIEHRLSIYGKNLPEERVIDATLSKGIAHSNNGDWEQAADIFRDVQKKHPDWDVPQLWLARYIEKKEDATYR